MIVGFVGCRKVDVEGGSLTDLGLDADVSAMMRDDTVRDGESQSGAFANRFGGEERVEDPSHGDLIHAVAGIGNT